MRDLIGFTHGNSPRAFCDKKNTACLVQSVSRRSRDIRDIKFRAPLLSSRAIVEIQKRRRKNLIN